LSNPEVREVAKNSPRRVVTLRSSAGTGTSYTTTKNTRNQPDRLTLRKYDQKVRQVVEFREHR
jgi:large subunit ribosomal protein L33